MTTKDNAQARLRETAAQVSNWGRWGPDDQVGTLNLIDSEAVRRGAQAIVDGVGFCLGMEFGEQGPIVGAPAKRFNPKHFVTVLGATVPGDDLFHYCDDAVTMPLQCATQLDALSHVYYDGLLYNGFEASRVLSVDGAAALDIARAAARPVITRGILLDIARAHGVPHLAASTPIGAADLQSALDATGIEVAPGDALLIRTGWPAVLQDGDRELYGRLPPGLTMSAVPWIRERDFCLVAADTNNLECTPSADPDLVEPVHMLLLRDMGTLIGEMFLLDELAAACATDGRWTFQLHAQPLGFTGAFGSPVNPVAVR